MVTDTKKMAGYRICGAVIRAINENDEVIQSNELDNKNTELLKIGSIEKKGENYIIHKEWYRQGMIFKDEGAYKFHKDQPCYSPELSDSLYTGNDFLDLCNGQQALADQLFEEVDWQSPETLIEENFRNREWVECERCGNIIYYGDGSEDVKCPNCGHKIEDD